MKVAVVTDQNAGFTIDEAKQLSINVIKMPIVIEGEDYFENYTISEEEFFNKLASTENVKTSQPSIGEIMDLWTNLLKEYDNIVHIPMSSALSEGCASSKALANDEQFKDKVFVVDNHRISVTLKSAVRDALYLASVGKSGAEIKQILEDEAYNSTIYIMVDTLKYLKRGGRVTPSAALLGEALHIKPVLTILGGKLDAFKKVLGTKKAKRVMIDAIKNDRNNKFKDIKDEDLVYAIAYTYDKDAANMFKNEVVKEFNLDPNNVEVNPLSYSVATHIGPGALAVTISKKIYR